MGVGIEGEKSVVEWFGKWPSFHDAEIIELHLNRKGLSRIKIHTWNMTDKVDEKNHYIAEKHAVIEFSLVNVIDMDLLHFNEQNVIFSLNLEKSELGYKLNLEPCYGLCGFLEAKDIKVKIMPGKPNEHR